LVVLVEFDSDKRKWTLKKEMNELYMSLILSSLLEIVDVLQNMY